MGDYSECEKKLIEKAFIERIRERAGLPIDRFSDEKVLSITTGTCLAELVRLELAYENIGVNIQPIIEAVRSKMHKDIERHVRRLLR